MNRQVLITFALIALTASACSKSDQNNSENNNKEHIRVNSSIDGVSVKSFADQTTALTDIQFLRIDDRSTNLSTFDFSAAASLTGSRVAGVSAPVVFSPTQSYLTATDETAYFVGYHPAGTVAGTEVSWEPKGATDILITKPWNAGRYSSPVSSGMVFTHPLARLEIRLEAFTGHDLARVQQSWGQVSNIKVKAIPKSITYDYATGNLTTATPEEINLLHGSDYDAAETANGTIGANANQTVQFASMLPPVDRVGLDLVVTTTKAGVTTDTPVAISLSGKFAKGQIHTITLAFTEERTIAATTTITDWNTGTTGGEIIDPPRPVPAAIGDYYYSDNTSSATFDAGKTLLGVVYRINPDGTGMLVEVTDAPTGTKWSTVTVPTGAASEDSGVANTNAIKVLDPTLANYPAFKHCEDKNTGGVTGWYLPANKELRALYAGISGLRWMASGANSANGEIDDWGNGANMPGNDTYTAARTAFNAKMTAAGVGGTNLAGYYWSATEFNTSYAWNFVFFSNGCTSGSNTKTSTSYKPRCVKEF